MKFEEVFEALNKVLADQKTTIIVQQVEIDSLKNKVEGLEKK